MDPFVLVFRKIQSFSNFFGVPMDQELVRKVENICPSKNLVAHNALFKSQSEQVESEPKSILLSALVVDRSINWSLLQI